MPEGFFGAVTCLAVGFGALRWPGRVVGRGLLVAGLAALAARVAGLVARAAVGLAAERPFALLAGRGGDFAEVRPAPLAAGFTARFGAGLVAAFLAAGCAALRVAALTV